jgi:hypothetical protein
MWAEIVPPLALSVYLFGVVAVTRVCKRVNPGKHEDAWNAAFGILWPVAGPLAALALTWRWVMDDSASPSRKPARVDWPHQRYTPGGVIIPPAPVCPVCGGDHRICL